jgi:hypothetical protein
VLALLESPLADTLVLLDLTGSPASAETLELLKGADGRPRAAVIPRGFVLPSVAGSVTPVRHLA